MGNARLRPVMGRNLSLICYKSRYLFKTKVLFHRNRGWVSSFFHGKFFRHSWAAASLAEEEPVPHFKKLPLGIVPRERVEKTVYTDRGCTAIQIKERGPMKNQLKTLATLALVSAMSAGLAQTTASGTPSPQRSTTRKPVAPKKPSLQTQIESLRDDMQNQQTQIQQLKQQLSDRDQQLQQAQQAAAAAQAAANQAQQQAQQQNAALTENSQAVSNLQGAVTDLKASNVTLTTNIQDQQAKVEKQINNPDTIHFKGVTLSPTGSFLAAETVWRQKAIFGDVNTQFTGLPLNYANAGNLSEFFGSGRQSRVALLATGKASPDLTIGGYYEADWLAAAVTSNNNQSNSYAMRQRQLWAQAHWGTLTFTGGQMWSLATETTKLTQNRSEILPQTIDAAYEAGFVWARQYGFRVSKDFGSNFSVAVSAENPQTLNVAGHNLPTNFIIGSAGNAGGLYNSAGTSAATTNVAQYSANLAPDLIAKVVYESPTLGHWELFGISRFFRDRVFPHDTGTTPSAAGAYNDSTVGGAVGGGFRIPTLQKHLDVGLKGLYGDGAGRYGSSTIADLTVRPDGQLALIHNFSAMGSLEAHVNKNLDIYANYGGDYVGRRYFQTSPTSAVGYGAYTNVETGCDTEPVPGTAITGYSPATPANCTADTKDIQELTVGYWYNLYNGPAGRLRQGIQYSYAQRNIWSGIGVTPKGTDNMVFTSFRYYLP
jgi:multidrug efflux pump subunit AcrA (membrane-fusion protein)